MMITSLQLFLMPGNEKSLPKAEKSFKRGPRDKVPYCAGPCTSHSKPSIWEGPKGNSAFFSVWDGKRRGRNGRAVRKESLRATRSGAENCCAGCRPHGGCPPALQKPQVILAHPIIQDTGRRVACKLMSKSLEFSAAHFLK